ncbi:hypothetical protein G6F22_019929 [Rhizopus arrhizus]|nr:hypothetical protein G6F22_019929 [Rhizopus arrhizus]
MKLKHWITALTVAVAAVGTVGSAQAQQFFRIGTGGTAGTYYPIGGIIGNAVSQPGKLIATAVASNGSVANINGVFGKNFQTTGLQKKEAEDLAKLLKSGSLAAPMDFVEERVVGPSLGAENVKNASTTACSA